MRRERGQSLIEGTLVLLAFLGLLLVVVDCGQVFIAHQSLVERARAAVRWGTLHGWQGPEPIVDLVLYNQPEPPNPVVPGYLGLTADNVQVHYQAASPERPDDELLTVAIVNYQTHLFSPWLARSIVSARPVLISAPMAVRSSAALIF